MNKLELLREQMRAHALDAYIVPHADEYLGEFIAPYAERLKYLTNFTGSAGHTVIMLDNAYVMSDGRYTLQLEQQLDRDLFTPLDSTKHPLKDWLYDQLHEGMTIGFDPALHSIEQIDQLTKRLEAKGVTLKPVDENLIDTIWPDQPEQPNEPVIDFPEKFAGQSSSEKITIICSQLKEQGADAAILTQPDSVCWLLNIRGSDVEFTPITQTYAYLDVHTMKVTRFKASDLKNPVFQIVPSDGGAPAIEEKRVIALDEIHTPYIFKKLCLENGAQIKNIKDPCIAPKARKTPAEQDAIRKAHIIDGAAMVKFLCWLDRSAVGQSEMSVAEYLEQCRREQSAYKGASFPTISGFGANGAVIHYRASAATNKTITNNNLLLLDSGGQYLGDDCAGTTDITRTIAIGEVSEEIKRHYTLVLKGHIALSQAVFADGTTGVQIDTLARHALQNEGLDYAHGTGHGVGCYLGVHEEASNISPRGKAALEEGMLLSNEPGYYKNGSHGIRIENLVFVQKADEGDLRFETVTLAPYDKRLIVQRLLNEEELNWLNAYHANVWKTLSALVDEEISEWLADACQHIG